MLIRKKIIVPLYLANHTMRLGAIWTFCLVVGETPVQRISLKCDVTQGRDGLTFGGSCVYT